MSYADMAAKGPKQSDAEKYVPDAVPEILHDDSGVHSLDSLASTNEHIQSLPSSVAYSDQQEVEQRAQTARREGERFADELAREASQFVHHAEAEAGLLGGESSSRTATTSSSSQKHTSSSSSSRNFTQSASARYEQVKDGVREEYHEFRREAGAGADKAKKEARKAERWADKNKGNPVVIGNAVVFSALAGVLGFGAYRLSKNESLTWKVAGVWAGAVGLFAVGDYFVSSWLFKKYPPKN